MATLIGIMVFGPWIIGQLMDFFTRLFLAIPGLLG